MKTMTRSLVDRERSMTRQETEELLVMKKRKVVFLLIPDDHWRSSSYGGVAENIPSMYLEFTFNAEKAILEYCSRELSELVPLVLKLRRN